MCRYKLSAGTSFLVAFDLHSNNICTKGLNWSDVFSVISVYLTWVCSASPLIQTIPFVSHQLQHGPARTHPWADSVPSPHERKSSSSAFSPGCPSPPLWKQRTMTWLLSEQPVPGAPRFHPASGRFSPEPQLWLLFPPRRACQRTSGGHLPHHL